MVHISLWWTNINYRLLFQSTVGFLYIIFLGQNFIFSAHRLAFLSHKIFFFCQQHNFVHTPNLFYSRHVNSQVLYSPSRLTVSTFCSSFFVTTTLFSQLFWVFLFCYSFTQAEIQRPLKVYRPHQMAKLDH